MRIAWKNRIHGGLIGFIGFMLSPLSWWNDLFVNVPLAIGFGWLAGWIHPAAFTPAVVLGYWLTNILGLILLHKGAGRMVRPEDHAPPTYTLRCFLRDLVISLLYTAVIVVLIKMRVLHPFSIPIP